MTPTQKRFIEAVNPEPMSAKLQFRIDMSNLDRLSRQVGYWNALANTRDENDEYDKEAIQKYEDLRDKQINLFTQILNKYEVTLR
jgi:hypothetical protein